MRSSPEWISAFVRDGFVHFEQLVNPARVNTARACIDEDLRMNYEPERQSEYDNRSFCPALLGSPELMALALDAEVQAKMGELLDLGAVRCDDGQIAIRQAHNCAVPQPPVAHIDGIPTATNGMSGEELRPFTMLLAIFLSDVHGEFAGNFTVWPGAHRRMEKYFVERGERARREGMPPVALGTGRQLLCKRGDAVLCHYHLPHAAAVNTSDFDRYAVFFRLSHHTLDRDRNPGARDTEWLHLTNMWTGWKVSAA